MFLRSGRQRRALKGQQRVFASRIPPRRAFKGFGKRRRFTGPQPVFPIVVPAVTGELKFHDLDINDSAIAIGATIAEDSCITIAQGTDESTRVGRKVTVRSLHWRFSIAQNSVADSADPPKGDVVRILLYLDKQANGATAATTDILESADYQSFNNLANKRRFRTLMDRTYTVGYDLSQPDGTNTGAYPETLQEDSFHKKVNIPIEYTGSTGAIAQVTSNNIGVMTLSKNGTATFESKMRVRFSDV